MSVHPVLEVMLRAHRFDSVGMICACGVECGVKCDGLTREQHLVKVVEEAGYVPIPAATRDAWKAIDELRQMIDLSNEMQYGSLSAATVHQYLGRIEAALHPCPDESVHD